MITTIRPWKQEDLGNLVLYANNINVWNNLRNYFPHPYTIESGKAWLEKVVDAPLPAINFAIDVDGTVAGGIGLILNGDVYIKSAEVGYWIGEPFGEKGLQRKRCGKYPNMPLIRLTWSGCTPKYLKTTKPRCVYWRKTVFTWKAYAANQFLKMKP